MQRPFDQAATLRAWADMRDTTIAPAREADGSMPKVLAIGGGKGGVGKTVFCANLACALGADGARVLAVDADLGLSNLDYALGASAHITLDHVLLGEASAHEALVSAAPNVSLLAGATGKIDMAQLDAHQRLRLTDAISQIDSQFDIVLVDMASGIGDNVMHFARAAQGVVVVATPEPTSLTDAYAFIKALRVRCGIKEAHLVANMVRSQADGEALYGRLAQLVDRFIGVDLRFLGAVCQDRVVPQSVRARRPFVQTSPQAAASCNMATIVQRLRRAHGLRFGASLPRPRMNHDASIRLTPVGVGL